MDGWPYLSLYVFGTAMLVPNAVPLVVRFDVLLHPGLVQAESTESWRPCKTATSFCRHKKREAEETSR